MKSADTLYGFKILREETEVRMVAKQGVHLFQRLSSSRGQNCVNIVTHTQQLLGLVLNVCCLPSRHTRRMVNHHRGVRQHIPFALQDHPHDCLGFALLASPRLCCICYTSHLECVTERQVRLHSANTTARKPQSEERTLLPTAMRKPVMPRQAPNPTVATSLPMCFMVS